MPDKKRILLVEDEKAIAQALKLKLENLEFEVVHAGDGEKGLAELEKGKFHLILLDLVMPNMDGFAFLEKIKGKSSPAVMVLTNLSQPEDEKRAKDLGAKGVFVKSNTSLADIAKKVQEVLK